MKVLHICSYFETSSLYKNLFSKLDDLISKQYVYVPTKKSNNLESSEISFQIFKQSCFNYIDRFFYFVKTNKIDRSLQLTIQKNRLQFDIVHAHSLFINGKVALLQKNSSGAKYIVAVRSTDVDVFSIFLLRRTGLKILMQK